MPIKQSHQATDWVEVDTWEHGTGWIAHPEEMMQRASHAIEVDGDVWVIDPVDAEGIDELLADLGSVAGVVVLLGRHTRDAEKIAKRHGVAIHVPPCLAGLQTDFDVPVEQLGAKLADTGFEFQNIFDYPMMREAALYNEETGTLVVADALGTAGYFVTEGERIGINPMLRLFPPQTLNRRSPDRILTGHGSGIHENATAALDDAFAGARRRAPSLYAGTARDFILG